MRASRGRARGLRGLLALEPEVGATLVLGAWILGAVPIQIGAPYRLDDVGRFLRELEATAERLDARLLVVSESLAAFAEGTTTRLRIVSAGAVLGEEVGSSPKPAGAEGSVALVQLTSGTTGRPRGVVITHEALLLHMESMSRALVLSEEARTAVSWLPRLLFPLFNGFPVYLLSPLDFRTRPLGWLEALSELRAGITAAPPSAYAILLRLKERAAAAKLDLGQLECAMIGAEPISARLLRAFSQAYAPCHFRPEAFFPVYGLAEATVAVTFPELLAPMCVDVVSRRSLEEGCRAAPASDGDDSLEFVAVGTAIPSSEIRIVTADEHPLPERHVGEIQVRSTTLMRGYFEDEEATRATFTEDGWLRTGDLGYLAGGGLFVTGREKELIIKGGRNVTPHALEEIVSAIDGVRCGCVAAVGVRAPELETEEIWVVAETKRDIALHRELAHRIRAELKARGMPVDQIRLVPPGTLPKTTSGKLERVRLRRELESNRVAARSLWSAL